MAPIEKKRKNGPTNESFARSRKTKDPNDRPPKRLRPDEKEEKTSTSAEITRAPRISKVQEEEVAFPRGGASILTPLEHKQIQIEATRDVLFEQQSGKSSRMDDIGEQKDDEVRSTKTKTKSKSKSKGKKEKENTEPEEESVKIEGLSYKVCCRIVYQGAHDG